MALTLNHKQTNKQTATRKKSVCCALNNTANSVPFHILTFGKYLIYRKYRLRFFLHIANGQWKTEMKEVKINGVKLISN